MKFWLIFAPEISTAMTAMRRNRYSLFVVPSFLMLMCSAFVGCASNSQLSAGYSVPANAGNLPDYSNLYYWAAHPDKKDPSDSTPEPYRNFEKDSSVDVFFLYPTSYTDESLVNASELSNPAERAKWNASLTDAAINEKTDRSSMLSQASAFNKYRVFSPRYRQAHFQSFFIPDSISKTFFDTAYADVLTAFQYYLEHYNHGRPFIIASHSQGTIHAARLIKELVENKPLEKQMVAAYLLGMPVRENYFSSCQPCTESMQTGCFVSWRTFKKGYDPQLLANENYKAVVVNPLNWRMDTLPVSKKYNKGAVLYNFNNPKNHAVSTQIHRNILWSSKPHFWGSIFFVKKNYHIGDINLFWKNIRDNVDERVAAYKSNKQDVSAK